MRGKQPKIGLLATHPIQYYAPWYRALAERVDLEVLFGHRQTAADHRESEFGVAFDWDVPLLDGYKHRFLVNRARRPDVSSFFGCSTPEISLTIRHSRFDAFIVHGWAVKSFWQAILACWRNHIPVMIRGDSHRLSTRRRLVGAVKWPAYRLFIPRFDAYLVVGERAREYYLHYGADPRRMFFTPHAVDNEFFAHHADVFRSDRGRWRAAWGIPAHARVFLYAGKFVGNKRPRDFVRGIAEAARQEPDIWGLMVGDGPLRRELESQVRSENWPVRFAGFLNQSEMPKAYAVSDALVVTSASESWGLVVNEAMACGLPAVVTRGVGCALDLVHASETGETFGAGRIEDLTGILCRLTRDPSYLRALGIQASRVISRYSPREAVSGTLAAIEYVMTRRSEKAL
jgi:glycosyltransferase involved in cell wall biosynthesis